MSIVTIRSTITKAVDTWAKEKGIPLAREWQPFIKPTGQGTFVELHIIPADTIIASLDGERKRYVGDVIINIWAKGGYGTGAAEKLAEEIVELFPVVPKIYGAVSIETVPSIKRHIVDGSGYMVLPVSFSYRLEVDGAT